MKKTSFFNSLPFKLLVAVILGIMAGLILNRYSTNESPWHSQISQLLSSTFWARSLPSATADRAGIYRSVHYPRGKMLADTGSCGCLATLLCWPALLSTASAF